MGISQPPHQSQSSRDESSVLLEAHTGYLVFLLRKCCAFEDICFIFLGFPLQFVDNKDSSQRGWSIQTWSCGMWDYSLHKIICVVIAKFTTNICYQCILRYETNGWFAIYGIAYRFKAQVSINDATC